MIGADGLHWSVDKSSAPTAQGRKDGVMSLLPQEKDALDAAMEAHDRKNLEECRSHIPSLVNTIREDRRKLRSCREALRGALDRIDRLMKMTGGGA